MMRMMTSARHWPLRTEAIQRGHTVVHLGSELLERLQAVAMATTDNDDQECHDRQNAKSSRKQIAREASVRSDGGDGDNNNNNQECHNRQNAKSSCKWIAQEASVISDGGNGDDGDEERQDRPVSKTYKRLCKEPQPAQNSQKTRSHRKQV
jgi:hypothetical protein